MSKLNNTVASVQNANVKKVIAKAYAKLLEQNGNAEEFLKDLQDYLKETVKVEEKFNKFGYVKYCILKSYAKLVKENKDTKEFSFEIRNYYDNQQVISWLNKAGALKVAGVESKEVVDLATGKKTLMYVVKIKDFNLEAETISKAGKEFKVFNNKDLGTALRRAV